MKDDSFVVEAFVKNVGKNYRNHKWIKKKVSIFVLHSDVREKKEKNSSRKFLRWSCLMANTRQQKKNFSVKLKTAEIRVHNGVVAIGFC